MDAIYLDHAATTPLRPEVFRAMEPFMTRSFGNPSSAHRFGRRARRAVEDARERLASAVGAHASDVVFVRGGTEGDNLAMAGVLEAARHSGGPVAVAHTTIAHSAIIACAEAAQSKGAGRFVIPVQPDGQLDQVRLNHALAQGLTVLSVLWVNNETGLILPVAALQEQASAAGARLHVDGVQAVGKIPVDLASEPLDLFVLTGHKLGGPAGVGALILRAGVSVHPLVHGGGQERGLRPGTEDVAGAVGLAAAVELAVTHQPEAARHMQELRDSLEAALLGACSNAIIHCGNAPRAPHVANVGFPGAPRDAVLAGLDLEGVAVSGGSACSSGSVAQSRVIKALYGDQHHAAAVRYSFAPTSTRSDVDRAVEGTLRVLGRLEETATARLAGVDARAEGPAA